MSPAGAAAAPAAGKYKRPALLTAAGCRGRRDRLWSALPTSPDVILLTAPRHLTYFTGYYPSPFLFSSQNAGAALILGADGSSVLIADNLLRAFADKAHVDRGVSPAWYNGRSSAPPREGLLAQAVSDVLAEFGGSVVGVDATAQATVIEQFRGAHSGVDLAAVGPVIHRLMRSKDPDELAVMRRSMEVGAAGFDAALRGTEPGMTEMQAYELVCTACMEAAGEPVIVYGDFASGPRTEQGGGGPTDRVIRDNELFILDCSAVIEGYRGDFANTFVVGGGRAATRQKEMAAACMDAMAAGEAALRPGALGRDIHEAVHGVFRQRGMDSLFTHHSGHGLGLGHPDPPYLVPDSEDVLLVGDVVTLEPGLYESGTGGMRFERNYLITDVGAEVLSHHHLGLERP